MKNEYRIWNLATDECETSNVEASGPREALEAAQTSVHVAQSGRFLVAKTSGGCTNNRGEFGVFNVTAAHTVTVPRTIEEEKI